MTLEQLRIFAEVARQQHLTRAAEILHLTPSAVSAAIKTLEERYATQLFNRIGRRIELNETGRIFLHEAEAVLARAQAAELTLSEITGLQRGSLHIYASQTIASYWLPPVLARFHTTYPMIDLKLSIGNSEQVVEALREGLADTGFIEGETDDPFLHKESVATDQLITVVRPQHPWAKCTTLLTATLPESFWILREQGSGTRASFEAYLRDQAFDPAHLPLALELPSNEAICSALIAGDYATVLSALAARPHLAAGTLKQVPFTLPPRQFWLLNHRERYQSHAFKALYAMVKENR
ncbi:LysR family transcriptional regulator [Pseudochrobactrum asaccharolyticum]|uniref:LysR family transcriptional regulator n=1 Tax=Pseudochrobactrum asaccharolyticum TaxID=354351 RepID=A0A366E6G9_9HYPH|nr:LysR family transcriptional regulator [Pseudochrobactrum asaccharolyticum]RBO97675.1 LysR family transcriptional regulator [Pseudochrobactrum asaccharolyticum]